MSSEATDLGDRVRSARKELGLSQAQLAGEELTKGFISQLESGLVRPSIRSLQLIAARLGRPLDYFLGDARLETGKRVAFHRLAAEAAAERRAWSAVRDNVEQAFASGPSTEERAGLLLLRGRAESAARGFEQVFETVREALALLGAEADAEVAAQLHYLRGYAYGEIGQPAAAAESLELCRDMLERHEVLDPRLRSRCLIALGTMYRRLGRTTKAITAYESALGLATRASELELAARGFMGLAVTHYDSGELDTAIAAYRRALDLFQRVSDVSFELSTLQSIADIQLESGDSATAKKTAERVIARSIQVGDPHWGAVAEVILSRIALRQGDPATALEKAKHASDVLGEVGDPLQQADARAASGAAYEAMGLTAEADRAYHSSIELYDSIANKADRAAVAAEYARVLRGRGEIDKAFEMLELANGSAARSA